MNAVKCWTLMAALLCLAASTTHAASLAERADAAFSRVAVRSDQQTQYVDIVQRYFQRQADMYKRTARKVSGSDLDVLVKNRNRKISNDTVKQMGKLLDAEQMKDFRYAIELADRSFLQSVGIH